MAVMHNVDHTVSEKKICKKKVRVFKSVKNYFSLNKSVLEFIQRSRPMCHITDSCDSRIVCKITTLGANPPMQDTSYVAATRTLELSIRVWKIQKIAFSHAHCFSKAQGMHLS